jgi:hypothetical protein
MIEGLKLDFTTEQLRQHLKTKIAHHEERVTFYTKQVDSLKGEEFAAVSGNPIMQLQTKLGEHRRKATLFRIIAEHLVPNEMYRLGDNDLERIELVSRFF